MKFLCDRCKTRYSIGDDRVRGKILKIRCKNCANVITVREGMPEVAEADDPARRRGNTTAAPPAAHTSLAPGNGALSAAFSAQLSKPPPALEEEWYVSIDGDQSGPFSLAEAQRWVASKAYEADLHCWSEGFDDWLPVDKVSHFRGLRKKPAPAMTPPPLPRALPRVGPPVDEDPKPLFAATMAAIEKGSGAVRVPQGSATPAPAPIAAKTNGSGAVKAPGGASAPLSAKTGAGTGPQPAMPASKSGPNRAGTVQGVGGNASPGAKALAAAFDVVDDDPADSLTAVEAPAFADEIATAGAKPGAGVFARGAELPKPGGSKPAPVEARAPAKLPEPAAPRADSPDEDNLEIGEVSRVVNLADLAKGMNPQRKTSRAPMLRATGSAPRISASEIANVGGLGGTGAQAAIPTFMPGEPIPSESIVAQAPVAASRRGMIILLAVAGLLLAGVLAAVVLIVTGGDDEDIPGGLRQAQTIDTTRPEDIVRRIAIQASGSAAPTVHNPVYRHPTGTQIRTGSSGTEPEITDPTKRELDAEEVEDMAAKQSDGTGFCYKRAQRGALGIEIQDLRKMDVTLTVDKEGTVNSVLLSSHSTDSLGTCLAARIRGWKFRQSSGTKTFKITLVFTHA